MKKINLLLIMFSLNTNAQAQTKKFDILSFPSPAKFKLLEENKRLVYQVKQGNSFCQIHLWPAQQGSSDPQANFKTDWDRRNKIHHNAKYDKTAETIKRILRRTATIS